MKIEIQNKEYDIPPISKLTVEQYSDILKECTDDGNLNYLKYINYFSIKDYTVIQKAYSDVSLITLIGYIGMFEDFKKVDKPETIIINDEVHKIEGVGLDTLGKEWQFLSIINEGNFNHIDELIWLLSVQLGDEDDMSKAEANHKAIMQTNYVDALSAAWFFFLHSKLGASREQRFIRKLIRGTTIKILRLKRRLVLKG